MAQVSTQAADIVAEAQRNAARSADLATTAKPGTMDYIESFLRKESVWRKIKEVETPFVNIDRAIRMFAQAALKDEALLNCHRATIASCILDTVAMGLEPGREVHFIPRNNKVIVQGVERKLLCCTMIVDWKGLVRLALRAPGVLSIQAHVVYRDDVFKYTLGMEPNIIHEPALDSQYRETDDIKYAYAVAFLREGRPIPYVMTRDQIEAIRERSNGADSWAWTDGHNYVEMCRKTPLRNLFKYLALPTEVLEAVDRADRQEFTPMDSRPPEPPPPPQASRTASVADKVAAAAGKPAKPQQTAQPPQERHVEPTDEEVEAALQAQRRAPQPAQPPQQGRKGNNGAGKGQAAQQRPQPRQPAPPEINEEDIPF